MHIVIIGAGIIGLTSAYYLRKDGYEVTVIEAEKSVGLEASKANGSQLSYNFVSPLAEPSVLKMLPLWLTDKNAPLHFSLKANFAQWQWGFNFLRLCRADLAKKSTLDLLALGLKSRELLHTLIINEKLDCDFSSNGKLFLYPNETNLSAAKAKLEFQSQNGGSEYKVLSADECITCEPAIATHQHNIAGGVFMPSEDSADSYKYCQQLYKRLKYEVNFIFDTKVTDIRTSGSQVLYLETNRGQIDGNAYVMSNGLGIQKLAKNVKLNPQIHALKGYSLTYELTNESIAPKCSVSDIVSKVVYARLGNRLRVAGMVDFGDDSSAIRKHRADHLISQVANFLPDLNPLAEPQIWAGLRPARPSSTPIVSSTSYNNLWINGGHGALGFTLAAASAALLSDRISGRPSFVSSEKFTLN